MLKHHNSATRLYLKGFMFDSATAKLAVYDDETAYLSNVFSRRRGLGHASKVMNMVTDYADEHGLYLYLEAKQYGYSDSKALRNEDLVVFYEKFGFIRIGNSPEKIEMYRHSLERG